MLINDVDLVAQSLSKTYGNFDFEAQADFNWAGLPALNTLDCVLSLNRRYDAVVWPRVDKFRKDNPSVAMLEDLKGLIETFPAPSYFMADCLNYRDPRRAQTLVEVVDYLLVEQTEHEGDTQIVRLSNWADFVRPGDAFFTGIHGFGLAGFQYLRMLFGAQTTKPDVHIRNYVSEIVGHKVNDATALVILERAAKKCGLPLRGVDGEIWKARARKNNTEQVVPADT